tara:strand:+ start:4205 stop:4585 length:381 start_codon:yes stop_codon:yes gene_type:complete
MCIYKRDGHKIVEKKMSEFNYQPSKSSLRADTVVEFVNRSLLDFRMNEIPGMGPASIQKFADQGIYTPAQIVAKLLSFVDSRDKSAQEVCEDFYNWANPIMGKANTHNLTFALANYAGEHGLFRYE